MAFLSVLCVILAKGMFIALVVSEYSRAEFYRSADLSLPTATMIISLQFIPQIILALFTTIGFSWSSMKLIFYHPETLILPSGTPFALYKRKKEKLNCLNLK